MSDMAGAIIVIVAGVGMVALYGIPCFIAFYRQHPNRWPIFLVNVVFGGTIIGWGAAMIWALDLYNLVLPVSSRPSRTPSTASPDGTAVQTQSFTAELRRLTELRDAGLISETEFRAGKQRLSQP